jgi:hypothetical protein
MSNVTPKRQRAGAVQDAFARFGSDRTALRVLECGSHLPLYVDEQRKSSANVESLPVWKPMQTQPLRCLKTGTFFINFAALHFVILIRDRSFLG